MILDTREMVLTKIQELKLEIDSLEKKPTLIIIKVGNNEASAKYVNNKIKRCKEVGIRSFVVQLEETITKQKLEEVISKLNKDNNTDAILLQLPLPKHLDERYFVNLIKPEKDVDGFSYSNLGKLVAGEETNIACTPKGIIDILKYNNIEIEGKDVLIINRSNIVGKPLAHLFLKENATVTIAHSKTKNLKNKIREYDIVVTAVGKANMFTAKDFKKGQTIIDVSINFDENGKMCGDVKKNDYDEIVKKGINITPVPNGVGQTTVLALIEQTVKIVKNTKEGK